jgi:hypothetical protein
MLLNDGELDGVRILGQRFRPNPAYTER